MPQSQRYSIPRHRPVPHVGADAGEILQDFFGPDSADLARDPVGARPDY
jgi:hypothetical protein